MRPALRMTNSANLEDEYWSKLDKTGQKWSNWSKLVKLVKNGQNEASTEDDKVWQPGG